jgi:hypothetical protein
VLKRQIFAMASFSINGTEMTLLGDANSRVDKLAFSGDGVARVDRKIFDTRVLPVDEYLAMYGTAIASNESRFANEKYSTIVIYKYDRCTIPAYQTYREFVAKEKLAGRHLLHDHKNMIYTFGRPYIAVGKLVQWSYGGTNYVMGSNFFDHKLMVRLPKCAADNRKKILWTAMEDAFHTRLSRYLSFEGIMMIFWQLMNDKGRLMGEMSGILSLSDIDCAQYVIAHLANLGGEKFQPEIATFCFSYGRNAPILYLLPERAELKASYLNNVVYEDDDMIIVPRHTGYSQISAASGFIVPDTCCFVVYPRTPKGNYYEASVGDLAVRAQLRSSGLRLNAMQKPLVQNDHGHQDTHYNVTYPVKYMFIGPSGDEFNKHSITGVEAHIIKACSRALDDFAWSGSVGGFRKCNVQTHMRVLANIMTYCEANPRILTGDTDVRRIVRVSIHMLNDAAGLMYGDPLNPESRHHYERLTAFADLTLIKDDIFGLRSVSDGYNKMTESKFARYFGMLSTQGEPKNDFYETLGAFYGMSMRTVTVVNAVNDVKNQILLESVNQRYEIYDVNRPFWSLGRGDNIDPELMDDEEYPSDEVLNWNQEEW